MGEILAQHRSRLDPAGADPRRWRALAVLGAIQFILVLDITVVNVALPSIQHTLGFSREGLAWVVNGYVIMAGGLLLLGGRLSDLFGRRRQFLLGVGLFALASAASGAAVDPGMLVASRFAQGASEALASPAALGLLAVLFPDGKERTKALGIWGGIAGLGGVSGVIISGLLTDLASWRWIFYVNVPVAAFALIATPLLVPESRMVRDHQRPDFTGAITATGGLVAVVYGLLQASSHAWGSVQVLLPLLGGIGLLAVTAVIEARSKAPLIPLRFFANRTRAAANALSLFFSAGFFTYFFLLTLYLQQVLHYSPLRGGLSYVPFGIAIGAGIGVSSGLTPRLGVKPMLSAGFFGAAIGLLLTSGITVNGGYLGGVLPGMIVLGFASGLAMPATINAALYQVTGQDSGLASGVQSSVQQVGGALGLACLVTLALRQAGSQLRHGVPAAAAATHGYVLAFRAGAIVLAVGGLLVLVLLERVPVQPGPARGT